LKEKILAFCLKHWKEIGLVLLLLVVFGKSQYDMRNIIKAHEISEQSMRTQIENLKSFHAKELELRDEAIEKYQAELQALEEQYEIRLVEIETLTKEEKEIIIKEFTEDKEALIQRFIDTYGLYYVQ
jgi:hypothetical protein|tara:strand:+ start:828 stop:1208 length:381 start_codon:yes stop_codon:yes gene_type:complete